MCECVWHVYTVFSIIYHELLYPLQTHRLHNLLPSSFLSFSPLAWWARHFSSQPHRLTQSSSCGNSCEQPIVVVTTRRNSTNSGSLFSPLLSFCFSSFFSMFKTFPELIIGYSITNWHSKTTTKNLENTLKFIWIVVLSVHQK